MKKQSTLFAVAALAIFPVAMTAQTANPECTGIQINTKAVALAAPITLYSVTDFSGSGGQLDPTPLLQTNINVIGFPRQTACVTVTFSTQADPQDNAIVFQASIDNVPMMGHGVSFFPTPVVSDPEETNLNLSRMLSYTFFASVQPGTHTVRIKIASCCTSNPTGVLAVRGATIVIRY